MADLAAREQRSYKTKAISNQPEVVERHSIEVVSPWLLRFGGREREKERERERKRERETHVVMGQNCMDATSFGENTYALRRLRAFLDQVCTRYFDQPTNHKGTHPPLPHVQMYVGPRMHAHAHA